MEPKLFNKNYQSNFTVYVGGLTRCDVTTIKRAFAGFGRILDIRYIESRGFAFVCFENYESASSAIAAMNGTKVGGNIVKCGWGKTGPKKYTPSLSTTKEYTPHLNTTQEYTSSRSKTKKYTPTLNTIKKYTPHLNTTKEYNTSIAAPSENLNTKTSTPSPTSQITRNNHSDKFANGTWLTAPDCKCLPLPPAHWIHSTTPTATGDVTPTVSQKQPHPLLQKQPEPLTNTVSFGGLGGCQKGAE